MDDLKLSSITLKAATELTSLLQKDKKLTRVLGTMYPPQSTQDFLEKTESWQKSTNSKSFAIRVKEKAIGLISLSHQQNTKARVGYWLASSHWHQGYGSQAVRLVIGQAKEIGLTHLNAQIDLNNAASVRIWEKLGATITPRPEFFTAELEI